jgi:cytosine/creatinine deaminase
MTNGDRKHAEFLFSVAKNTGKDIDVHIDQENNPDEKDTEWFVDAAANAGLEAESNLDSHDIGCMSQNGKTEKGYIEKIKGNDFNVTVCPWAAISMKQLKDKVAPVHNSIAQVDEMIEAGINVGVGNDNISDIFVPENNGDLFEEIKLIATACRLYDIKKLAQIATTNGAKTLKI